jgi:hypothetical protein
MFLGVIPDTVVHPGAVMIHVEDAAVAHGAVVTPLGLEHIAHQAIPAPFVLWVAKVEAPEDGDLPRVRRHGLQKRPDTQGEQEVEQGQD